MLSQNNNNYSFLANLGNNNISFNNNSSNLNENFEFEDKEFLERKKSLRMKNDLEKTVKNLEKNVLDRPYLIEKKLSPLKKTLVNEEEKSVNSFTFVRKNIKRANKSFLQNLEKNKPIQRIM